MKKITSLLFIAFSFSIIFTSCKKYPDGPGISFRSAKHRIVNTWKFSSALLNGIEMSEQPEYATQKQYWNGDGTLTITNIDPITGAAVTVYGNWVLSNSNKNLAVSLKNVTGNIITTTNYTILMLKEKEMWLRSVDNSIENHFVTSN